MRKMLLALGAALALCATPAYADPGAPITTPGQTTPQVLDADVAKALRPHAATPGGGTASLGKPCTGYSSNAVPPATIRVYRHALGRVDVVDFKTYVKNSLPREWVPSWHAESLKSGAMAVKTYAWYRVLHWKGGSSGGVCYDLRDDTVDQTYVPGSAMTVTSNAVDATWGVRMTKNGSIFEAAYCSNMYCTFSGDTCASYTNGIRLSQWGTQACALRGEGYQKILSRYYYSGLAFAATTPPTPVSSWSGASGDLTGDGRADILARDTSGNLILKTGSGAGNISSSRVLFTGFGGYRGGVRGDFTGDGRPDLIAQRSTGTAVIYKGTAVASAPLAAPVATTVPWPVDSRLVSPGDANYDGRADVYGITKSGSLVFYAGNGNGTFRAGVTVANGWNRFSHVIGGKFAGSTSSLVGVDASTGAWFMYNTSATGGVTYARAMYGGWNAFTQLSAAGNFGGRSLTAVGLRSNGTLSTYNGTGVATSPVAFLKSSSSGWSGLNALL